MVRIRARRLAVVLTGAAAVIFSLTSCSLIEGPTPKTPERAAIPAPETTPELVPGGTAVENEPFFAQVMQGFASGENPVQGQPVVNTLTDAGFLRENMQVSHDLSRTGLLADSIFVSVRYDGECLLGQVTTDTRELAVSRAPAVGPEKNVCIVGDTRQIDW